MLVTVQLKGHIDEALTQYRGCPVLDADEDSVWIAVEASDVDVDFDCQTDLEPYEFWGEKGVQKVQSIECRGCSYMGRPVLNAEEVVEQLMEEGE